MNEQELAFYAKIAYDAYSHAVGGKSAITGALLPPFDQTPALVQKGWLEAAAAVIHELETNE